MRETKTFERLAGVTVAKLLLSEDATTLAFITSDGQRLGYAAEGDCCNDVWFHHISGVDYLLGATVAAIEDKDWRETEVTRQDVEEACLWSLTTDKGVCDIEVRNSHNGYYGGEVIVWDKPLDEPEREVTEDF